MQLSQTAPISGATSPASLVAHTPNANGVWHQLADHLRGTAERAQAFAAEMGPEAAELAYYAGLWHDLGKAHPRFQQYLVDQSLGIGNKGDGGDHKGAGAVHSLGACDWLSILIAGHHGGLPASTELKSTLTEWREPGSHVATAIECARAGLGELLHQPGPLPLPAWVQDERTLELFLRMLFSVVVDSDFLDTERHFDLTRVVVRSTPSADILATLWERLSRNQEALIAASSSSPVNEVREEVWRAAVTTAAQRPGFFRLTVPTGGGKTRSGMGFALRHAILHGLPRVIVAVPYISITEQTVDVYRGIFADLGDVVLEHHSAVVDEADGGLWRRLAAENWDVPVIVTTTVQLFESLLGYRTSAVRKLHNIVGSIIVLDEAQMLPPRLLTPLLDVLRQLVEHYGVTVIFSTATQPAYQAIPGAEFIAEACEIAPDPPALFRRLERVAYQWPTRGETSTWPEVAERIRQGPAQCMAIVNTLADAAALLAAVADPEAIHLSRAMCGAHRRVVLADVRRRLQAHASCRLIATQVVEAGVDLDFPAVLRALGPLDGIIQAAGRCNREGRMAELGRVMVFDPADGKLPPGTYRVQTQCTRTLAARGVPDVDAPATYARYTRMVYGLVDTDEPHVQDSRRLLDYPETAKRGRLIEDEAEVQVAVPYYGPAGADLTVDRLLAEVKAKAQPERARHLRRQLQPYMVGVREKRAAGLIAQGLIVEVSPDLGVWEWRGPYDPAYGLLAAIAG